jgi:hypothetical protein
MGALDALKRSGKVRVLTPAPAPTPAPTPPAPTPAAPAPAPAPAPTPTPTPAAPAAEETVAAPEYESEEAFNKTWEDAIQQMQQYAERYPEDSEERQQIGFLTKGIEYQWGQAWDEFKGIPLSNYTQDAKSAFVEAREALKTANIAVPTTVTQIAEPKRLSIMDKFEAVQAQVEEAREAAREAQVLADKPRAPFKDVKDAQEKQADLATIEGRLAELRVERPDLPAAAFPGRLDYSPTDRTQLIKDPQGGSVRYLAGPEAARTPGSQPRRKPGTPEPTAYVGRTAIQRTMKAERRGGEDSGSSTDLREELKRLGPEKSPSLTGGIYSAPLRAPKGRPVFGSRGVRAATTDEEVRANIVRALGERRDALSGNQAKKDAAGRGDYELRDRLALEKEQIEAEIRQLERIKEGTLRRPKGE